MNAPRNVHFQTPVRTFNWHCRSGLWRLPAAARAEDACSFLCPDTLTALPKAPCPLSPLTNRILLLISPNALTCPTRNYTHITDQFTVHRSHPITSAIATNCNYSQSGISSLLLTRYAMWSGRQYPVFRRTLLEIFLYWDFRHQSLVVGYRLFGTNYRSRVKQEGSRRIPRLFKIGPIGCPETSVGITAARTSCKVRIQGC